MENKELKEQMKKSGLYLYQVANELGVCEMTLIRWLRFELPDDKKQAIIEAINKLQKHNNV